LKKALKMPILANFPEMVKFTVSKCSFAKKIIFNFGGPYLWTPLAYRNVSILVRKVLVSAFIWHPA
jgi:hypothetical protein